MGNNQAEKKAAKVAAKTSLMVIAGAVGAAVGTIGGLLGGFLTFAIGAMILTGEGLRAVSAETLEATHGYGGILWIVVVLGGISGCISGLVKGIRWAC